MRISRWLSDLLLFDAFLFLSSCMLAGNADATTKGWMFKAADSSSLQILNARSGWSSSSRVPSRHCLAPPSSARAKSRNLPNAQKLG